MVYQDLSRKNAETKVLHSAINREIKNCIDARTERPTVAALIEWRGRYLIISSANGSHGGFYTLGIPKGAVVTGETALSALRREVREELGIRRQLSVKGYLGAYSVRSLTQSKGFATKRYFVFHVLYSGKKKLRINGELSGYYWMTISEVRDVLSHIREARIEKFETLTHVFDTIEAWRQTNQEKQKKKKRKKRPGQ